jgi:SpoVK/Ycf46/Vps4 family AAA+-type ATPase
LTVIGVGFMLYGGLDKLNQDLTKMVHQRNKGESDNLIKTQAKWTPIEIAELSKDNLKKMNFEKPLLPENVKEKIDTQLEEIGKWKSNMGINGISQSYQSVLLYGPTGSGKSSVARQMIAKFDAKATEDSRTHYHIKIEPTMLSSEHGNAKLGKLLDDIKQKVTTNGSEKVAFSILMDECDGALKQGLETANQYNTMIDAFTKEMNVPILQILTTNHLDDIDPRTIRLGRCGTKIEIPNPDPQTKRKIMEQSMEQFTFKGERLQDKFKTFSEQLSKKDTLTPQEQQYKALFKNPMKQIIGRLIDILINQKLECQVYNPETKQNESQNKSLDDLLKDETISGATISEIMLTMIKNLTIKAETKEKDKPSANTIAFLSGESAFIRFMLDTDEPSFIQDYDAEGIIADAISQALTQKSLEQKLMS